MSKQWVPLLGVNAAPFVFIEAFSRSGAMKLYHESFHEVEFVVRLTFGLGLDFCEYFWLTEIDVAVSAIFFVRCDAGEVPFLSSDISLMFSHT